MNAEEPTARPGTEPVPTSTKSRKRAIAWRVLGAVLAPPLSFSFSFCFLGWMTNGFSRGSKWPGYLLLGAAGMAIVSGGWFVMTLPMTRRFRIFCVLAYVPLSLAVLYYLCWLLIWWFFPPYFGGLSR